MFLAVKGTPGVHGHFAGYMIFMHLSLERFVPVRMA